MSVDFQVVLPQVAVPLTSVTIIEGSSPRFLDVYGMDFTAVDAVTINEIDSPSFAVLSDTHLVAEVPASITYAALATVAVISRTLTLNPQSIIKFKVSNFPAKTRGILRLVQLFLKVLLTTPGTDIFVPRLGGGALRNLGRTFGQDQQGNIVSDFIISVDTTARQIISLQGGDPNIPAEERLLSAKVTSASFDRGSGSLIVTVVLQSQTGQPALANLVI